MQLASFFDIKNEYLNIRGKLIQRARFGLHLQLANLSNKFIGAFNVKNIEQCSSIVKEYFQNNDLMLNESGVEAIYEFLLLLNLNELKFVLPFVESQKQELGDGQENAILSYDYIGRVWVNWIHKIAKNYNWSKAEILDLIPEEVLCYIQEIILDEYTQLEVVRANSQVAYTYDEGSKKYKYIPTPKPNWMLPQTGTSDKVIRVAKSAMPVGNIVDLNNFRPN